MKKNKNDSYEKDNYNNSKDNTSPQSDITFSSSRHYPHMEKNKESIDNEEHEEEEDQNSEQKQSDNAEESEVSEEEENEDEDEEGEEENEKGEEGKHTLQFTRQTKSTLMKELSALNAKYNSIVNELALAKKEINKLETIISSKNTIITEFQKLIQGSILKLGIMEETNMTLNHTIEENEAKIKLLLKAEDEYKSKIEQYSKMVKELKGEIDKQKTKGNHNMNTKVINLKHLPINKNQSKVVYAMKMNESDYKDKLLIAKDTIYRLERKLQAVCIEIKEYKNEISKLNHILFYYEDIIKSSNKKIWDKDTIIRIHNEDNSKLLKNQIDFDQYKTKSNKKIDRMYQKLLAIDKEKYSLLKENEDYNKEIATLKYKSSCDNGNNSTSRYNNCNECIRLQLDKEELEFKIRNVITSLKVLKNSIDNDPVSSRNFPFVSNGGCYHDTNQYCVTLVKGIEDIIAQIEPCATLPFYMFGDTPHSPQRSITPTPIHTVMATTHYSKHNRNTKSSNHSFTYEYTGRKSYL